MVCQCALIVNTLIVTLPCQPGHGRLDKQRDALMKKLIGLGLVLAVMASSVQAKDFTAAQKEALKAAVKEELLDPDSARFTLPPYKGGNIYCGLVNSKNSFGGYAGNAIFQAFVVSPTYFMIMGVGTADPESTSSQVYATACSNNGYSFN